MGSESRRRKDSHKEKKCPKGASKSKKSRYSSSSSGESSDSSEESGSSRDKSSRRRKYRKDELQGELRKLSLLLSEVTMRREKMLKHGCWECKSISASTTTLLRWKPTLLSINCKDKLPFGGNSWKE